MGVNDKKIVTNVLVNERFVKLINFKELIQFKLTSLSFFVIMKLVNHLALLFRCELNIKSQSILGE